MAALASAGADIALYARDKQDLENVKLSVDKPWAEKPKLFVSMFWTKLKLMRTLRQH